MHEFSIALSIVEIAEEEVKKCNAISVERIDLEIGKLSGIEPVALEFALEQAVIDTVLGKAVRNIEYIPGKAKCLECGIEFEMKTVYEECPACHSYFKDFIRGKEMKIKSLTLIK
jgi:hydrogenase nickel incorporation protein HypA/HybF